MKFRFSESLGVKNMESDLLKLWHPKIWNLGCSQTQKCWMSTPFCTSFADSQHSPLTFENSLWPLLRFDVFMSQSISSITILPPPPRQSHGKFSKSVAFAPSMQTFCHMPGPRLPHGPLLLYKFYTYLPLSRSKSLSYPKNIWKS